MQRLAGTKALIGNEIRYVSGATIEISRSFFGDDRVSIILKNVMDPITLLTSAITMLSPYMVKSGEKVAEEMGASLWNWLKSKLAAKKQFPENVSKADLNTVQLQLMSEISTDSEFAKALETKIAEIKSCCNQHAMKVENNATIQKQVNITHNSGSITL